VSGTARIGCVAIGENLPRDRAHVRTEGVIQAAIDHDEIGEPSGVSKARGEFAGGIAPIPRNILGGEAHLKLCPVGAFPFALIGEQHRGCTIHVPGNVGQNGDVETGEMSTKSAADVERGLETSFLAGIVMDQQKNVFHDFAFQVSVD
jgi:hypothetical protein